MNFLKKASAGLLALTLGASSMGVPFTALAESTDTYTVNIQLMQFHSEGQSMGNASMNPEAHIVVNEDGTADIQIDLVSLTYLNQEGYLGKLQKVTNILAENEYHYPTEIETLDAVVLEEYVDIYDKFNDPASRYYDVKVGGKWYPKKISIPIDFESREDDILVQVYVPVMESIMKGGGTKFAVLDIDWDSLSGTEPETLSGDVNGDGAFSVSDVILLQKWLLAVPDTHLENWKAADFCADDTLNVFDLCLMKRALLNS